MSKDNIRKGYYVRLLCEHWFLGHWFLEGRVVRMERNGFYLSGDGYFEFVRFSDVVAYRLGRYG